MLIIITFKELKMITEKIIDGKVYKIHVDEFDIEAEKAGKAVRTMAGFGTIKKIVKKKPPQCFAITENSINRYSK